MFLHTKKKKQHIKTYYMVNDWYKTHPSEVQGIRNYISYELMRKRKPSVSLVEEAIEAAGLDLPFTAKDLVRYSRHKLI